MAKVKKLFSPLYLIDSLVILLNATYGMSMLKVWLLDPLHLPHYWAISIFTFSIYLFRFRGKRLFLSLRHPLPAFLLIIYFFDILQGLIYGGSNVAFIRFLYVFDVFIFLEYLLSIYQERKNGISIYYSFLPFELFSIYNVVVTLLCVVMIYTGILNAYSNPMPVNSLILSNVENLGRSYYFPGHLSLSINLERSLADLGIPVLTGLTHEPHVLFWILGPAFFLLERRIYGKGILTYVLYISFLLMLVISTSATAVIVFAFVVVLSQIRKLFSRKGNRTYYSLFLVGLIATVYFIMSQSNFIFIAMQELVADKIAGAEVGSRDYSLATFEYMFTPQNLLGMGNFPQTGFGFKLSHADIGYITCFLDIIFYVLFAFHAFKNFLSTDVNRQYIGLACIYFLLHSLKLGAQIFSFPYIAFAVMMIVIADNINKKVEMNTYIKRNISSFI